jgi:hypothetical protein
VQLPFSDLNEFASGRRLRRQAPKVEVGGGREREQRGDDDQSGRHEFISSIVIRVCTRGAGRRLSEMQA